MMIRFRFHSFSLGFYFSVPGAVRFTVFCVYFCCGCVFGAARKRLPWADARARNDSGEKPGWLESSIWFRNTLVLHPHRIHRIHTRGLHNSSVSRGPNECYVVLYNVRSMQYNFYAKNSAIHMDVYIFISVFFRSSRSFLPFGFNLEMYGAYVCSNIRAHNRIHVCVWKGGRDAGASRQRVSSAANCRATLLTRGLLMLKNSAKDNKL